MKIGTGLGIMLMVFSAILMAIPRELVQTQVSFTDYVILISAAAICMSIGRLPQEEP